MQKYVNKYVRVSDISSYLFCPRAAYFGIGVNHTVPDSRILTSEFIKALSQSLCHVYLSRHPAKALDEAAEGACVDLQAIYGDTFEDTISSIKNELLLLSPVIIEGMRKESERLGSELFLRLITPLKDRETLYSDRLGISGSVDRIIRFEGHLAPVIVSSSGPPASGAYRADRVRLAAYALLMAEKYGFPVDTGAVEYFPGWRIHVVDINSGDRRMALLARDKVRRLMRGFMPETRKGPHCEMCLVRESCGDLKVSLLDRLFM